MRYICLSCYLLIFFCHSITAQSFRGRIDSLHLPVPEPHYNPEFLEDIPVDSIRWLAQERGLHIAFGSADKLYFRREVPELDENDLVWEQSGWRGERINTQIILWSSDSINQLRFTVHDLKKANGKLLSKSNIKLNMVRYVLSNYPYSARNTTCDLTPYKDAFLMPDRLEAFERFDIPGKTVRSVWLSCNIPAGTEPGLYRGSIEVQSEQYTASLQVQIRVQAPVLPVPGEWKYRLDLWQNPWVIAWYYKVSPWSEEHKALLLKHLQLYADAGGKYITTYAVHSPWSDNSYMIEGGMIEWTKRKNSSWKFDYSIFDQYVELAMKAGVKQAITIYTPVPFANRFRYLDEASGNYVQVSWPPTNPEFKQSWHSFLTDLKSHLEKKGWLQKTYIGINESSLEETLAAIDVVKAHWKHWRITYAGNWHKELDSLLDDYSFLYGFEPDQAARLARSAKGFSSTYYVCCNPAKPNNFVFSPPVEGRWISWYAAAAGYDGFLRWAYDAWPANPVQDARHILWPAGDCFLVYPGSNSSIRFEKLREGIVDFEKIRILRTLASKRPEKKIKDLLKELDEHLLSFLSEKDFNEDSLLGSVEKGKRLVNSLSDALY